MTLQQQMDHLKLYALLIESQRIAAELHYSGQDTEQLSNLAETALRTAYPGELPTYLPDFRQATECS